MYSNKDTFLSQILIDWYQINKRELPWRHTSDPYKIWLSEVILQQTRVDQGHAYYIKFIEKYPTVKDLSEASEDEVLKLWQGLGYYSRARNLRNAAKQICEQYGGKFPTNHKDILALKGIGVYTAAAITSFAYNDPYAVVDGNVFRVLARIFAINTPIDSTLGKKEFTQLAQKLMDKDKPALHNQAIMEFGALQCTPNSPKCDICPASGICLAYSQNSIKDFPVKQGKTKIRHRYFNYFDIRYKETILINKRTKKDIWQNLYELPLIETEQPMDLAELSATAPFKSLMDNTSEKHIEKVCKLKHILSHQIIHASFYRVTTSAPILLDSIVVNISDIDNYAVPQLVHKYLAL